MSLTRFPLVEGFVYVLECSFIPNAAACKKCIACIFISLLVLVEAEIDLLPQAHDISRTTSMATRTYL